MSKLRPELGSGGSQWPTMTNGTAYLMILNAVQAQPGLLHGKLHDRGAHCAIGSYFAINNRTSLYDTLIDEVAAVNDSMPTLTPRQRKLRMARWLKWKLAQAGMPGFRKYVSTPK